MTDLVTHQAKLVGHLARFRETGILNLIGGQSVKGAGGGVQDHSPVD